MAKDFVNKKNDHFIKKSNTIVRAVTNECAGIMTQRLFNFAILSIKNMKDFNENIKFWLKDFCNYYNIAEKQLYDKVIHKKQDMSVIQKEIQNITQLQFLLFDEKNGNFKFVNLFLEGGLNNGYVELKVNKDLTTKYYLDLKSDYTNVYLPYTKEKLLVNIQCVYMSICEAIYIWMLKLKKLPFMFMNEILKNLLKF